MSHYYDIKLRFQRNRGVSQRRCIVVVPIFMDMPTPIPKLSYTNSFLTAIEVKNEKNLPLT